MCGVSVCVLFLLVLGVHRIEDIMSHCYSLGARGPLNRRDGISVRLSHPHQHDISPHTTHHRMMLRLLQVWCKSPNNKRILSYKDALQRTECESIEKAMRPRRLFWSGALLRMGDRRLPKRVMSGELDNTGKRGPGGKEK